MDATQKFKTFLKTLSDDKNKVIIESLEQGFSVCFEDANTDPNLSGMDSGAYTSSNDQQDPTKNLDSTGAIEKAIETTKDQETALVKLNDEQKGVDEAKANLAEVTKKDQTEQPTQQNTAAY